MRNAMRALLCAWLMVVGLAGMQAVQAGDGPGLVTLAALQETVVPPRDRVDLARRFLGVKDIPPAPATAPDFAAGDVTTFHALNTATAERFTFQAQAWYVTPVLVAWFQEGFTPDMTALAPSLERFSSQIYPTVRRYFGTEASPGIDGDPRLHIVHAGGLGDGVAAYFDPDSEFPRVVAPSSNERQMFMVNLDTMRRILGKPFYEWALAHEFQHMIHAHMDSNELNWLDEGLAELAASVALDRPSGFLAEFTDAPETQLNAWSEIGDSSPHYGGSYLFAQYFLDRFGEDGLRALIASPLDGIEGVRAALTAIDARDAISGEALTFERLFADWAAANYLNAPEAGPQYAYTTLLPGTFTMRDSGKLAAGGPRTLSLPQFGTTYLYLQGTGQYTLTFDGAPTAQVVPTEAISGDHFWWSNRGDQIDTRLTRAFDLRGVTQATLTFRLWYDIEEDWDFGYVVVSTDDGMTWRALESTRSVPAGGDNNPYGPAFTGSGDWREEQVDLTPFAGQNVRIRFEYLTDAAVHSHGMALDDIAIPEIGYFSDAETGDDGWQAEGWARIDNRLPALYLIQRLDTGSAPGVIRVLEGGQQVEYNFEVPPGGKLVFAFSGLTEFTTEPSQAGYTLLKR